MIDKSQCLVRYMNADELSDVMLRASSRESQREVFRKVYRSLACKDTSAGLRYNVLHSSRIKERKHTQEQVHQSWSIASL